MKFKIVFINLFLIIEILYSNKIIYNFGWGIEKLNHNDLLTFNLSPEFKLSSFAFQIKLDVEVNSNFKPEKYKWNGTEDIIRKLKYFKYNGFFNLYIGPVENLKWSEKFLIYNFSNQLFYPILEKRGLIFNWQYKNFILNGLIDDIIDYDIYAIDFLYKFKKFYYGIDLFFDSDNLDPYSDKGLDSNFSKSVSYASLNASYEFFLKKLNFKIQNELIKNLESKNKFIFITGPEIGYYYILIGLKYLYGNSQPARMPINYFYEIERDNFNKTQFSDYGAALFAKYEKKDFLKIELEYLYSKDLKNYLAGINLVTGDNFYTKFLTEIKIYNKSIKSLVQILSDRDKESYISIQFKAPLSKNLFLVIGYLKSFKIEENLKALRLSEIKTEFKF